MYNPFRENTEDDKTDQVLISTALAGSLDDMERLILRHQSWIYNIALRMVFLPEDAEDVTQEILIKIITNLSTYDPAKGALRTWLYKIVVNHIITMKKRSAEKNTVDFENYATYANRIKDKSCFSDPDKCIEINDLRINCTIGMLICLTRRERLIFILGTIFNVSDSAGSEIMGISRTNFRKILSRTRAEIREYLNHKYNCGLVNDKNTCSCSGMYTYLRANNIIKSEKLIFHRDNAGIIKDFVEPNLEEIKNKNQAQMIQFFQDQPFYNSPDYITWIRKTISNNSFKDFFKL